MYKHVTVVLLASVLTLALSGCGTSKKGSAAALEVDGKTVIYQEKCRKRGRTYDYVSCGKRVRAKAKEIICQQKGPGKHEFLYRTGKSQPIPNTARCDT